jgi:transposase
LEQELEPRLEEAKKGKRTVFFVDASHFVHGAFIGFLWCIKRIFIPTPSGRKRYNVLGAINAISHELVTVCNDLYINSISVCELLQKIYDRNTENIPVTLVMDNASYQRCKFVTEKAKELNIELLFLPSYSPNLNIIERLWKWTKKECLNSKYHKTFADFKDAINTALDKLSQEKFKEEFDSLLNLKFQMFDSEIYDRG